jgi:two-component system response regulator PilR (NtrC family)
MSPAVYHGASTRGKRLLVVDDDPIFREVLGMRIERWGYSVRVARGAREAKDLVHSWHPHHIVSDVVMPEETGIRLVTALRSAKVMCPVVLLTAHGTVDMARDVRRIGGVMFLPKPVDYVALRAMVDGLLSEVEASAERPQ